VSPLFCLPGQCFLTHRDDQPEWDAVLQREMTAIITCVCRGTIYHCRKVDCVCCHFHWRQGTKRPITQPMTSRVNMQNISPALLVYQPSCCCKSVLERCNPWPHVANRHISISQLLSLRRHSRYDVIRASSAYGARSPRSDYDVILVVTSFATELATPTVTDVRNGHLTAFNV